MAKPNTAAIKAITKKVYGRDLNGLKSKLWVIWVKKTFWSDGYFVCSVGNAAADTIQKYIQEQLRLSFRFIPYRHRFASIDMGFLGKFR